MAFEWFRSTLDYLSSRNKARPQDRIRHERLNTVLAFIALAIVVGVIVVGIAGNEAHYYITVSLLWSGAFFITGWIVGFLFGIPRTVQHPAAPPSSSPVPGTQGQPQTAVGNGTDQTVNTNLEQISDWLTKIIVGLGLTQIAKLPAWIRWLSNFVGSGIVTTPSVGTPLQASAFAAGMFTYFTGVGFTGGYLLTRLILADLFRGTDAQDEKPADVSRQDAVTQQTTSTTAALTVVPVSIPQKQATDVTISAATAILGGATVTSADPGVVIGPAAVNKSDGNHATFSVTVPAQGQFVLLVHPDSSVGLGDLKVKVTGQ